MNNLRDFRLAAGFTQQALAEATGLSQSFISEIESGIKKPGFDALKALANVLGCTIDKLVGHEAAGNGV